MTGNRGGKNAKLSLIRQCESIIKSFNPVTHSIDTHLGDIIGPQSGWGNEEWFIQQCVTGWYKEKKMIDSFISNMYADNGARITRTDMTMYTLVAYLAIYRIKELSFSRFKELCSTEDPSKISVFIQYLFNKESLWNNLRDSWMRINDLKYVEDIIITNIEKYIPNALQYINELDGDAAGLAAAEAAKEEAKKNGTSGMGATLRKSSTRPISPKLSKPRPPLLPEPEKILSNTVANEIPSYLNNITMDKLYTLKEERKKKAKESTLTKYKDAKTFNFNKTKGGKSIEQLRAEAEENRSKDLDFDASFVHDVPNFNNSKAVVRVNAATILREDYLYRKQQNKDEAILKAYEEELRDPVEYFAWQQQMKENDEKAKHDNILLQRKQAKQSSEDAHAANAKLLEDNRYIAKLIRKQGEVINEKRSVEREIELMNRQVTVSKIAEVRDYNPSFAVERAREKKVIAASDARIEMEEKLLAKEKQDKIDEDIQADKIRKLRAINDVHKSTIKVFDPTEVSGMSFLNKMSYMEMKERINSQKTKNEMKEMNKRDSILESKQKRAHDLQNRANSVLRARQVKAEAFKGYYENKRSDEINKNNIKEKEREIAAISLEEELRENRRKNKEAAAALIAEQERIKRAQAYLGAAAGQKEETAALELQMASERAIKNQQREYKREANAAGEVKSKEKSNRTLVTKKIIKEKKFIQSQKDAETNIDRRVAVEKIKADVMHKKMTAGESRYQAVKTQKVREEFNPYAEDMRRESVAIGRTYVATGKRW